MNKSIDDHIDAGEAVFKWVQHTPVGQLKILEDSKLSELREELIKEVRSVGRALQWVDGIIKLKKIERHKTSNKNAWGKPNWAWLSSSFRRFDMERWV